MDQPDFARGGAHADNADAVHVGTEPKAVPGRFRHVDGLRAVAAGLVIWFHFDQTLGPLTGAGPAFLAFLHAVPRDFDLGRMGVMLFFAISGFVIPRSFDGPRQGGTRRFLIRRFCRLYPAYWVSLLGGLLVWRLTGQTWTWTTLAANATMVPGWLGQPRLLGVYWTLEIELLFYGCCLGLHLAHGLHRRALLAGFVVALAGWPRLLKASDQHFGTHLALNPNQILLLLSLAVMFWGAIFRAAYDKAGSGDGLAWWKRRGTLLVALLAAALVELPDPKVKWFLLGQASGPPPGHLAVLTALVLFAAWVAWLRVDHPLLTRLGVISYSLYLFHPVVKYVIACGLTAWPELRAWNLPLGLYLAAGMGVAVAVAAAIYRWVEHPAIALGKHWAGSHAPLKKAATGDSTLPLR